jgi:hypothetical protein
MGPPESVPRGLALPLAGMWAVTGATSVAEPAEAFGGGCLGSPVSVTRPADPEALPLAGGGDLGGPQVGIGCVLVPDDFVTNPVSVT